MGREQKNAACRTPAARYASTVAAADGENALRSSQKVPKFFVSVSAKARDENIWCRNRSIRAKVLTVDGGSRPHAHAQRLGLLGVPVLQLQRLRVVVIDAVHQALGVGVCGPATNP